VALADGVDVPEQTRERVKEGSDRVLYFKRITPGNPKSFQASRKIPTTSRVDLLRDPKVTSGAPSGEFADCKRPYCSRDAGAVPANASATTGVCWSSFMRSMPPQKGNGPHEIHADLSAEGRLVGRKRVSCLIYQDGLVGVTGRRWTVTTHPDRNARATASSVNSAPLGQINFECPVSSPV